MPRGDGLSVMAACTLGPGMELAGVVGATPAPAAGCRRAAAAPGHLGAPRCYPAAEPWNNASPKVNRPPSEATSQ